MCYIFKLPKKEKQLQVLYYLLTSLIVNTV